jgi:hypothetical protein
MEAVQIRLLFVDNNRSAIMVNISVVIALFNDDGFVAVPMITVADEVTIAVPVTISLNPHQPLRQHGQHQSPPLLLQQALRCKFQPRRRSLRHTSSLRAPIVVKLWEGNAKTLGSFRLDGLRNCFRSIVSAA